MTPRPSLRTQLLAATAALALLTAGEAVANPTGGQVVGGQATITGQGQKTTTIDQTSNRAIINWTDFSNAAGEAVVFHQPSATSATLNRVTGPNASVLMGQVQANGQIYLINSRGVLFGKGSAVNTAGLVVSTAGISDRAFLAGTPQMRFDQPGAPDASIVLGGSITVADAGLAAFVAPSVAQSGVITARYGKVALGAGTAFTLDLTGDGLISFLPGDGVKGGPSGGGALVQAGGQIVADSGSVLLTAAAARQVINQSVSVTGLVSATQAVVAADGHVRLGGARRKPSPGSVTVAATGDVSLGPGAVIDVSSTTGRGGAVTVTGANIALAGATLDASGATGGGTVRIGGGAQGQGPLAHARTVAVDAATTISADATGTGDGGHIVLWSDQATAFSGTLSALGGRTGGNGGLVETSSKQDLTVLGHASAYARSTSGKAGEWLLDPTDITIVAGSTDTSLNSSGTPWIASASTGQISVNTIQTALNAGTSVAISTNSTGSGSGDITLASGVSIAKTSGGDATLTLSAYRNLTFAGTNSITSTAGKLGMTFTSANGLVALTATTLTTNGGDLTVSAVNAPVQGGSGLGAVTFNSGVAINVGGGTGQITGANPNEVAGSGITAIGIYLTSGASTFTASGSGRLTLTGSGDFGVYLGGDLTTNGTVSLQGTALGLNATGGAQTSGLINTGTLTNNGTLSAGGYGTSASVGTNGMTLYGTISNAGVLSLTGTSPATSAVQVTPSATIQNTSSNPNASITITATGGNLAFWNRGGTLLNSASNGAITVTSNGTALMLGSYTNQGSAGTVRVTANGLALTQGTFTNLGSANGSDGLPAVSVTAVSTGQQGLQLTGPVTAIGPVTMTGTSTSPGVGPGIYGLGWTSDVTLVHKNNGLVASTLNLVGTSAVNPGLTGWGNVTASGAITLNGTSTSGTGVLLNGAWTVNDAASSSDAGNLVISGTSTSGLGLTTYGGGLTTSSRASVSLSGTSTSGNGLSAYGVTYANSSTGTLSLSGTSGSGTGLVLGSSSTALTLNGTVSLSGTSASGSGVSLAMGSTAASQLALGLNAAVTITGLRTIPSVATTDLSVANAGGLVAGSTGASLTLGALTPAGSANSGAIFLNGLVASALPSLTLTTHPAGVSTSGNLLITGALSASGTALTLSASGSISDTDAITASSVAADAGSGITLTHPSNAFTNLAASNSGSGAVSVYDSQSLTVGTVGGITGVVDVGGAVSLISAGNLTVQASVQSGSTGTAAVVLAAGDGTAAGTSTGGDVMISGTSTAVATGTGGTAVIYTGSLAGTQLNALVTTGHYRYGSTRTQTNYTLALPTGLDVVYRQQPTLTTALGVPGATVSGGVASLVYDATAHTPVLSVTGGAQNGDVPLVTAVAGPTAYANAGSYTATASGLKSELGYAVSSPANLSWSITPLTLSITGLSVASRVYDGSADVSAPLTVTGSVGASNILAADLSNLAISAYPTSGTFAANGNAGTGRSVTVAGSAFTLTGSARGNYQVSDFTLTGDITKASLSVNTAGLSVAARTYDGTRTAAISGTGTRTGTIYSGDTVTLTQGTLTGLYDSANAGLRTVTVGGFSLSGASAGNYSLAPVQLAATLAQAPLTVQGLFVQDKVYDRTTTATLVGSTGTSLATSTVTLGGIVGSDDVRLLNVASQTAVFADANAATNISVGLTSAAPLSLTGAAAANYVLTAPVLKGNITPATLTVTGGITAQSRAYDGTTNATLITGTLSTTGLVSGDVASFNLTGLTGRVTDKNVNLTGNTVIVSGLSLNTANPGNYTLVVNPVTMVMTPATLSVTGLSYRTRVYDGTTNATLNSTASARLSGVISGDVISLTSAPTGTYVSAEAGTTTVHVGGLGLSGSAQMLADYALPTSFDLLNQGAITPRPLTVSGLSVGSRAYDGTSIAPLTGTVTLSNVIGNDLQDIGPIGTFTGTFGQVDVGTGLRVNVTAPALSGGAKSADYVIIAPTLTGAITPKVLAISNLGATSKIYDGTTGAALVGTARLDGVVGTDGVALDPLAVVTGAFRTASAGTGKPVDVSGLVLTGDAAKLADYVLPQVTLSADIAPKVLSFTGLRAQDKTYDGSTFATVSQIGTLALTDVLAADQSAVRLVVPTTLTGAFSDMNAGTGKSVAVTGLRLDGAAAGNYVLNNPLTATISPKALSVTQLGAANKVYDGTTAATLTGSGILSGVLQADQTYVSLDQTRTTGAFQGADVANGKAVTLSQLTLAAGSSGDRSGNYSLTLPSLTANITPATLILSGLSASSRDYDGTTVATLTGTPLVDGVVAADRTRIQFDFTALTGTFQDPNAGNGKAVTLSGLTFTNVPLQDYVVTVSPLVANITKARLVVTGLTVLSKVYDGTATGTLNTAGLSVVTPVSRDTGRVGIDLTPAVVAFSSADVSSAPGGAQTVTVSQIGLTGSAAANYTVDSLQLSGVITPRPISANGLMARSRPYDRTALASVVVDPSIGVAGLDGVLAADKRSVSLAIADGGPTGTFTTVHAGTGIAVDVAGLSLGGSKAGDYSLNALRLYADITKAIVTASGYSIATRTYDTTTTATVQVAAGAGLTGVYAGDEVTLVGTPSAAYADAHAGTAKSATVTGLSIGGASRADYQFPGLTLTGVVTPAPLSVAGLSAAASRVYDATTAAPLTGTARITGVYASDTALVTLKGVASGTFADAHVGAGKSITLAGLSLSGASGGDYALVYPTLSADVTPATVRISGLTASSKVYDGLTLATLRGTAGLNGVMTADQANLQLVGSPSAQFSDAHAGQGKAVILSGFTLGGTSAGDYVLATPLLSASITPAILTYTADPAYRSFGGLNPTFHGTVSGFVAGETLASATTGTLAFTSDATPDSGIGSFAIDGGGLAALFGNYTFSQAPGNATALTIFAPFNGATIGLVSSLLPTAPPTSDPLSAGPKVDLQHRQESGSGPTGTSGLVCNETGSGLAGCGPVVRSSR